MARAPRPGTSSSAKAPAGQVGNNWILWCLAWQRPYEINNVLRILPDSPPENKNPLPKTAHQHSYCNAGHGYVQGIPFFIAFLVAANVPPPFNPGRLGAFRGDRLILLASIYPSLASKY